jgi:hypothetical protein
LRLARALQRHLGAGSNDRERRSKLVRRVGHEARMCATASSTGCVDLRASSQPPTATRTTAASAAALNAAINDA